MSPAARKAPLLAGGGRSAESLELEPSVFDAELKPHLVHEAVRAELNAHRAPTRGGKSRGLVSGGRSKPWRQKGTGRARAGSIRAPQFTGGGVAFPTGDRRFEVKVNRKAYRSALRAALSEHARNGTLGVVDPSAFEGEPSTKRAAEFLTAWGKELPLLVVADESDAALTKSFRNLERVVVVPAPELEVAGVVWARSLLVSRTALEALTRRAGA